jgi:hypothetical protein
LAAWTRTTPSGTPFCSSIRPGKVKAENAALRRQLIILQRKMRGRVHLSMYFFKCRSDAFAAGTKALKKASPMPPQKRMTTIHRRQAKTWPNSLGTCLPTP